MILRPYSMSRLVEYERCPRRFKFKYIEKLPELTEDAGVFGKAVHKIIAERLKGNDTTNILAEIPLEMQDLADVYVKRALSFDLGEPVGVEVMFAVDENFEIVEFDSKKAVLRGIIDLITKKDGKYYIWDWKTGRSTPTAFQVMFYAYAVSNKLDVAQVGYVLLSSNELLTFDVTVDVLKMTALKIKALINAIEQDEEFIPKPGPHCAYCSWIDMCPLSKAINAKDIPAVRTEEEAKNVLKQLIVLKEKVKKYQNVLKKWLEDKPEQNLEIDGYKALIEEIPYKYLKKEVDKEMLLRKVLETEDPLRFIEFKDVYEIAPDFYSVQKRKNFKIIKEG